MAQSLWTTAELDTVRRMTLEGFKVAAIAAALPGRTDKAVARVRSRNGWYRPESLAPRRALVQPRWSPGEVAKAQEMTRDGFTAAEVAAALTGRTAMGVRMLRHRKRWLTRGLKGRPPVERPAEVIDLVDTDEL